MSEDELYARAKSATAMITDPDARHCAIIAWLDGFQAGHSDATKAAIETIRETKDAA